MSTNNIRFYCQKLNLFVISEKIVKQFQFLFNEVENLTAYQIYFLIIFMKIGCLKIQMEVPEIEVVWFYIGFYSNAISQRVL